MKGKIALLSVVIFALVVGAWAQGSAPGVLNSTQVKQYIPQNYFFAGRLAPVEPGQAAGIRLAGGKLLLAAMLETSGYATSLPQKLQGLLITEVPVKIEGSELKPGAYGFGFNGGKFVVMDVAAGQVLAVVAHQDEKLRPAVPLKIAAQSGGTYRLYAGKDYVTLAP